MIHIIIFGIIIFSFICRNHHKLQNLSFCILAIIASIRYMYGNDYVSYYRCFQKIKNGGENPFKEEILFTFLNDISPSFYFLITITSVFFVYVIYGLVKQNIEDRYIWLSLFVLLVNPYLFLMNMSAIRQAIAMCLFIIAVECALNKQILRYIGLILIAALFHKSAIILLPVIFLINSKKITRIKVIIIVLSILFLLNVNSISLYLENLVKLFNDSNYLYYIKENGGNSARATFLSSIYCVYILCNLPKLEGKYLIYGKLYLCSTILAILAYKIAMFTRVQMYFDIYSIIIIPYIIIKNNPGVKLKVYRKNICRTLFELLNRYVFPFLIIIIYLLRYYSFFNNPMWIAFYEYNTIFSLL